MALQSIGVAPIAPTEFLTPEQDELNKNAFIHRELAEAVRNGRSYEDGLAGLIAQSLEEGPVTGEPRWRRRWTTGTGRVVEFKSFAAFVESADGLATNPAHLLQLLEISKNPEVARLSDQVRQSLKLKQGRPPAETADNVRSIAGETHALETGNSAAGVRRKIRNWLRANADHPNHALAQQWLAKLEANPRSRLHQQALREIGIGKAKRVLDVSNVSGPLIERLYNLAQAEEMTVAEVLEDALAVYFRMDDEGGSPLDLATEVVPNPRAPDPAPAKVSRASNGPTKASKLQRIPEPGLYGASQLARAAGVSSRAITDAARTREDGDEVLTRTLADTPVMAVVRKANPQSERYEVLPR